VPGTITGARPFKAKDLGASAWTKAAQQRFTPALIRFVAPQQPSVGVSGTKSVSAAAPGQWRCLLILECAQCLLARGIF
jgi:sarcosine oxidase gamma subunit